MILQKYYQRPIVGTLDSLATSIKNDDANS